MGDRRGDCGASSHSGRVMPGHGQGGNGNDQRSPRTGGSYGANVDLARWQFAFSSISHFVLAPGTIGLTFLNALLHCPVVHSSAYPRGRIRAHGLAVEETPWVRVAPGPIRRVPQTPARQAPEARALYGRILLRS
jgi:hypothetical protein